MERNVMFLSPRPYQSLITITFFSSEIEVAMCYSKLFTRITADKDFRHTHGIYAAAYRKKGRFRLHYYLDAIVQMNPKRRDSLNWILCFVSPSFSLKIITLSS